MYFCLKYFYTYLVITFILVWIASNIIFLEHINTQNGIIENYYIFKIITLVSKINNISLFKKKFLGL